MSRDVDVADHYANPTLIEAIRTGLATIGKTPETVAVDDLAPVDEFHIGGRRASVEFLDQLGLAPAMQMLDVGCGLGGCARFVADRYGCSVTGIDLTADFVATGNTLTEWIGLADKVVLRQGSALAMPFESGAFDGACMMHVGMNIADKETLMREVARVLRSSAVFGIYDVMRTGDGHLALPVPWASQAEHNAIATPERYRSALEVAGFRIARERNRRDFALDFFKALQARNAGQGGPPPVGLHMLMGKSTPDKIANMLSSISAGLIAPVEIVAYKS